MVHIDTLAIVSKHEVHLGKRLIYQLEHLMDILILLDSELLLVLSLALDGAGKVVATVTNALYLGNRTQHRTNLRLGIITQMGIAHLIQILGYLNLHIIRNALILLDALIELVESLGILGIQQLVHHTEHTVDALAETANLLLCLEDRKLRSLHDTRLDKAQAEILILLIRLRLDKLANHLFQLWNKPDEYARIADIEAGVEHRQDDRQQSSLLRCRHAAIRVITHNRADEIHERIEQAENPDDTKHIEHQMSQSRTARLGIGTQGSKVGSSSGSDVLTHHQGNAQIDREYARRTEQDGNRHHRCRTLHDAGDKRTYQEEDNDGKMALRIEGTEEVDNCRIMLQIECLTRTAQQYEREEEEGDTKEEIAEITALLAIYQHDAEEERREHDDS